LTQISETHDPETFEEDSGHPNWDTIMSVQSISLFNGKRYLEYLRLSKGRKLVRCKWVYINKYSLDGSVEIKKS
jgi:hypothetical protein